MDIYLIVGLLFGVGLLAGFINVSAGGGSSLTLPLMIFLGLDPSLANGTNRIAILLQNASALISFRTSKIGNIKFGLMLGLLTVPGAILGAVYAVNINAELFKWVLSGVLVLIIISMIFGKKNNNTTKNIELKLNYKIVIAMLIIGFYGGFIQVGVGFLLMFAIGKFLNIDLVNTNFYKVIIVLIYTIPAIIIFAISGKIDIFYGFCLAAGNVVGGFLSAKLQIKKGEKIVKYILFISIIIIVLKLTNII